MASPPRSPAPPALSDKDAVEEPPRREHRYTTANMQPERPWKRYAATLLLWHTHWNSSVVLTKLLISFLIPFRSNSSLDDNYMDACDKHFFILRFLQMDIDLPGVLGSYCGRDCHFDCPEKGL